MHPFALVLRRGSFIESACSAVYQPGESSADWLKLKLERQQEFVIGGYRPDGAAGIDALLVGYY
jgi:ATP-dependent DNA ligase